MDELFSKLSKKGSSDMSPEAKQAKMEVIMELMEMARELMGSGVKSGLDEMQKVSVMAPDAEGLEEGLEVAEDLVGEEGALAEAADEVAASAPPMVSAEDVPEKEDEEDEDEDDSPFGKPKAEKPKRKMFNMFDDED